MRPQQLFLITICSIILLACKKDKVPCTTCPVAINNCEDIQNIKHFFYFKVGSWWVYQEENSGDLDTIYVTEALENPTNFDFDVRAYSTYEDYYYHFWPEYFPGNQGCPEAGTICKRCLSVKRSKYKPGNFVSEGKCFFFTPSKGEFDYIPNIINSNNLVIISETYFSYNLNPLNFERTIKVHEDNSLQENYQETNHYFSENVGLVRKELLDSNKIWNLIDYHIEL